MSVAWYDILGTVGVAIIILTYVLLQIERLRSDEFLRIRRKCHRAPLGAPDT
ncbi:MAG: hypothetical protein ACKVQW_13080 [Pyrinomonadaceae bacterium]